MSSFENYKDYIQQLSDEDLKSIILRLDREKYPEKFEAIQQRLKGEINTKKIHTLQQELNNDQDSRVLSIIASLFILILFVSTAYLVYKIVSTKGLNPLFLSLFILFISHCWIVLLAFSVSIGHGFMCACLGWIGPLIFAIEHGKLIRIPLITLYISTGFLVYFIIRYN